jgi:hypothetical protein
LFVCLFLFTTALDGRGREALMLTELYGGARIAYIFNNIFCSKVAVRVGNQTSCGPDIDTAEAA